METMKTKSQILTFLLIGSSLLQGATDGFEDARDHLANTKSFITQKRSKLAIQSRSLDIFGLPQNPKKAREIEQKVHRQPVAQARRIPFQKIVDSLPVTLMNPGSDLLILEGAGPVRAGRTLEFSYEGKPVQLRLEGVRANGAYFRDLKSRKLVLLSNQKMPEGIKRGNQNAAKGDGIQLVGPDKAAPINIDIKALQDLAEK